MNSRLFQLSSRGAFRLPKTAFQGLSLGVRGFSAAAEPLNAQAIEDRVLQLLKDFDKVVR